VLKWLSSKRFCLYHSNPLSSWSWNDQFWGHTDLEVSSDTHNCYWSGIVNICEMKSSLEWVLVVGDSKPEGDVRLEKDNAHIHTSTIRSSIDRKYLAMCRYFFRNQTYRPNNIWRSYDRASWQISYNKPTRCTNFSNLFGRKLYMVQTVPLSIIRSFSLYTQQWYISYRFFWQLASRIRMFPSWSCLQAVSKPVWHIPLLCVQWKTPDDGQRNCLKHVEFLSK